MNKTQIARRKELADLTNVSAIEHDMVAALRTLRQATDPTEGSPEDYAMAAMESFVAISLHVMQRCPPHLIRNAAQVIEIRAHLDGVPVFKTQGEPA